MDKAEEIADKLLQGRMSCESCEDLSDLVERVKSNELDKNTFTEIIRNHLNEVV